MGVELRDMVDGVEPCVLEYVCRRRMIATNKPKHEAIHLVDVLLIEHVPSGRVSLLKIPAGDAHAPYLGYSHSPWPTVEYMRDQRESFEEKVKRQFSSSCFGSFWPAASHMRIRSCAQKLVTSPD